MLLPQLPPLLLRLSLLLVSTHGVSVTVPALTWSPATGRETGAGKRARRVGRPAGGATNASHRDRATAAGGTGSQGIDLVVAIDGNCWITCTECMRRRLDWHPSSCAQH
jgi:hypothetical protein